MESIIEAIVTLLVAAGIPSAIIGIFVWRFKKSEEAKEKAREEKEKNTEKLMLMIMQNGRAAIVLAEATARAIQRIPDAKCNGDMTSALEKAEKIQKEEQEFLLNQGIQHIFGNN